MCLRRNTQSATVRTNSHIGTGMVFHMKTYQNCVNDPWEDLSKMCQYHRKMVSKCSHYLLDMSMTHTRNINIWKRSRCGPVHIGFLRLRNWLGPVKVQTS